MKRIISMLLAMVMVFGLFPMGAAAEETVTAQHTDHCICGGTLTGIAAQTHEAECTVVEGWTAITAENFAVGGVLVSSATNGRVNFAENGHYYLAEDVSIASVIELLKGADITICLNGHTLTSTTTGNSAIRTSGMLNICDCRGGGKITAKSAKAAGMVNVLTSTADTEAGTTFNLYGGELVMTDNNFTANAGVIQVGNTGTNKGIFNMYGGSIAGGTANKGGNILLGTAAATMNMYGGSVTGGAVKTNDSSADRNRGGNIYVNKGTLNVYGGTISGGVTATTDKNPALGGDIFQIGGTVYLNTDFATLDYANDGTGFLTLGADFSAENVICKSLEAVPVKMAEGTEQQAKAFTAENTEYYVAYENGELILKMIPVESIELFYDDRKDLRELVGAADGAAVTVSDETVTSNAVGTSDKDAHVLVCENGTLYAVGTGTAKLTVDDISYDVTVSPAPISLFMITGHSIGRGEKGNGAQSVAIEAGQAYSTHRYHTYDDTGSNAIINPDEVTNTTGLGYGAANRLTGIDAFAAGQGGTEGEGSALAWQWNQLTGEKVWIINAAVGGSCLNEWIPGAEGHNATYTYHYDTSVAAFKNAQAILDKEIAAGHYTLSRTAIIYHSAANFSHFSDWTQELIEDYYDQMWNGYKTELDVEVMGLVPIWTVAGRNTYSYDKAANFYMAASEQYEDVFMASLITRNWMTAAGLSSFPDITYTTQSTAVTKPTSVHHTDQGGSSTNSVFCSADTTHLSQVTYNAQGIDIANNMYAYWNGDKTASSVELRNSINELLDDTMELAVGENTYAVPVVDTVYANNLTISVEGDITVKFPMQIVAEKEGVSTITISQGDKVLKTLTVTVTAAHSHCACGNHVNGHACENVTWTPWGDDYAEIYSLPTTAGYYYLTKDMTVSNEYNIGEDTEIFLCLNGHNITNTKTDKRVYNIYGKLNICDCAPEEEWGTISGSRCDENASALAGTFQLRDNREGKTATVNLYSGIITAANPNELMQGGVVQLGNTGTYGAVFNMYGGKLIGSNAVNGGTVYIMKNSVFNLYDGEVSGGTASGRGGNFYIEGVNSQLNISGGTVTGGTALNGGNIYMNTGSTVTVTGGYISNGTANTDKGYGGNIRVNAGSLTISGVTVSGGNAKYGGSLAVQGTAVITDSTIQTATGGRGRALYIDKAGSVTVKDSNILNLNTTGTTVWVLGKLTLQGTVNMPAFDATADTLDLMVDAQKGAASIDISGLTGQDAPFGIRRWELDETDDDPGLIATGATQEQLTTAFFAWRLGYTLSYADGSIYLVQQSVYGMGSDGKLVQGYDSVSQAIEAANETVTYLKLQADLADQMVSRDVLIDLNGHKLTNLTIAEGVTLSGMDSTTDDYDCTDGYGTVTLSENSKGTITTNIKTTAAQIGSVKRYLTVNEEGVISFHRFYMGVTHMNLRPGVTGVGYKAIFAGDSLVQAQLVSYGYNLWVGEGSKYTASKTEFVSGATVSLRLQNFDIANYGQTNVNATVYMQFANGVSVETDTYSYTLRSLLETINGSVGSFSDTQMSALQTMCEENETAMSGWDIGNILNWTAAEAA